MFTPTGLITYYVLFFSKIGSREVQIAGVTPQPDESLMKQVTRNAKVAGCGFLWNQRHLIFDRDSKFCACFRRLIRSVGIKTIRPPPRSPDLDAEESSLRTPHNGIYARHAERLAKTIKEECSSRLVLFGEPSPSSPGRRDRVQAAPGRDIEVLLPRSGVVDHG